MNILAIAAHPDDEVLGCGGTLARWALEGHKVCVMILGEGITSRYSNRGDAPPDEIAHLHQTSQNAAQIMGVQQVLFQQFPDNRFDTVPLLEVAKAIESAISDWQPEVVYTQHGGDLNIDHVVTYRATLIATRPLSGSPVHAVYAYEVASSSEWAFQSFAPVFKPNLFTNIEATLPQKIAAMQAYETEARAFPHPRSPEALEAQARRWGSVVGLAAAEAFEVVREIR